MKTVARSEQAIRPAASTSSSRGASSRSRFPRLGTTLLIAAIVGWGCLSNAATTIWTGASTGGVFNDDANWSANSPGDNTPPPNGLNDLGIFNSATNVDGTITFDADVSHFRTFVQNTAGTIAFDTGPHTWAMSSFFLTGTAAGELNTIRHIGGNIRSESILLGNNPGTSGNSIEVTGAGTLWHTTATGAAVRVGSGGSLGSTFTVHNGGKVTTLGQTILGLAGSGNGRLYVTDTGVLETANYLGVGHSANGTTLVNAVGNEAHILNGGTVVASHVLMGITVGATNSRTLVSGADATLTLTGAGSQTEIGMAGANNTLEIVDGGAVLGTNRFRLGQGAASTGNQLLINNGTLNGRGIEAIRGDVTITDGLVDLSDVFSMTEMAYVQGALAATEAGTSSVTFNSGTVKAVRANINNGGVFTVGDGGASTATYEMKKTGDNGNGVHTFANGLFLSSNAVLQGSGDIAGSVSGAAGALVDVGLSPGTINVAGAWDNTDLSVALEVGDLASLAALPGVGYDLLGVTGVFTHGGTVNIDVSDFVAGSGYVRDLKLIGWDSDLGSQASTLVSFIGGPALSYEFRADGLYLTDVAVSIIPEPATVATLAIGLLGGAGMFRRIDRRRGLEA